MQRFGRCSRVLALSALMAVVPLLRAQDTPAPATAPAASTRPATAPSTAPSTQAATKPATTRAAKITLNFKDAPLDNVLDYLSDAAGFVVIKDGPVDGRVSVLSKQPVTPEEAVTLLSAVLKANGFTAIQQDRTLRIVARDKAKKGSIPVHFGADPANIEATEELITQVIPIKNVDAVKLHTDLASLIAPEADHAASGGSNAIIITDSSANIRRLAQIISQLDQHEASISDMRIVQLKYAQAAAAAKLIQSIFKSDVGGGQPNPQMMQPGMPQPPGGGGDQANRGKVLVASDERTNTLVITGPTESLKLIDGILDKLDANPALGVEMRAFTLNFAEAEATSKLITSIFKGEDNTQNNYPWYYQPQRSGDQAINVKITAAFDERTNTVIVTAPAATLKLVEGLIKQLDANQAATSDLRVFTLKYADASSAAKLITSIFNPENDNGRNSFLRFFFYGGPPSQQKGPKLTASADDRTNTLVVTGPTELLKAVEGIVTKLDSNPASEETLFIYRLRNGTASNLELVLNTLFGNIQQNGQQNPNQNNNNQNGGQNNRQGGNNNNFGSNNGGSFGNNNGNGNNRRNQNRASGQGNNNQNRRQLSPGAASAVNELSGEVFVVADPDTNSLLVTTAVKYEKKVRAIIDELDRPVPQVLIKVLVAEVTHDNSADFGVDFSVLNRRPSGNGQTYGTNFGTPTNGLIVSILESNLNASLHALAQQGKLDVLSRPYIIASDNQPADILVGQSVPFVANTRVTETGQTVNSIEYRDVGIILNVTPHINPDGLVILDVSPEISQLTNSTVPVSENLNAPIINVRSADSRVGIKNGQTIVIGGLMEDRKNLTVSKVPLLGDIPVLRYLFSRTQVTKTKTELLIFLTPHVASQPEALKPMSQDEMRGTKLTPRAVEPGTFDEHMRGMQRGANPDTKPVNPGPKTRSFDETPQTQPATPSDLKTKPGELQAKRPE